VGVSNCTTGSTLGELEEEGVSGLEGEDLDLEGRGREEYTHRPDL